RLENLVPGQAEILPVQLRRRAVADPVIAPRILAPPLGRHVERDVARDSLDRDPAAELEVAHRISGDGAALELDRRIRVHGEEIAGAKVRVALLRTRRSE